jgi:hypothetical protein
VRPSWNTVLGGVPRKDTLSLAPSILSLLLSYHEVDCSALSHPLYQNVLPCLRLIAMEPDDHRLKPLKQKVKINLNSFKLFMLGILQQ